MAAALRRKSGRNRFHHHANGTPLNIVGVAPPGFDYPAQTALDATAFSRDLIPTTGFIAETIGRLKPDIAWAQTSAAFWLMTIISPRRAARPTTQAVRRA